MVVLVAGLWLASSLSRRASMPAQPSARARVILSGSARAPSERAVVTTRPWLHARAEATPETTDKRLILARIQSNLERAAASLPPAPPTTPPVDELERVVDAYAAYLSGDERADEAIENVDFLARKRLSARVEEVDKEWRSYMGIYSYGSSPARYLAALDRAWKSTGTGGFGKNRATVRLAVALRRVDAALLLEQAEAYLPYDLFAREQAPFWGAANLPLSGVWLKLPCRTIVGRRASLELALRRLGKTAGPLVGCPVPKKREGDLALAERLANDPAKILTELAQSPAASPPASPKPRSRKEPPPPPWDRETAAAFVDRNPDAAERALCAPAGALGNLDCALFLHTFRPPSPARDARIRRAIAAVDRVSAKLEGSGLQGMFEPVPYDGNDKSLIPSLQKASVAGAANSHSAFYAIPCAVLERRPALLAATESQFGSNGDNFIPRSGCDWGRGRMAGFPDEELQRYRDLSEEADGHFYLNHMGTIRYGLAANQAHIVDTLKLNPRALLSEPAPPRMKPYETWSLLSLTNRDTFLRLDAIASSMRGTLFAFYEKRGLSADEARMAVERVFFTTVWGAECGGAATAPTLRRLLVERAPLAVIRAFVDAGDHRRVERLAPFVRCADAAGMDPLLHIAVGYPAALSLVWQAGASLQKSEAEAFDLVMTPDVPNAFGKTPLMVAAARDEVRAARFLLDHGADPNLRTELRTSPALAHDARTALMYAAARGSLEMIRLLVRAGTDVHAADTKGATALDYLVGNGPLPNNPKLSPSELDEAARLLF